MLIDNSTDDDLLGTFVRPRAYEPTWPNWDSLQIGSLETTCKTVEEIKSEAIAAFLPLSRYSGRLLKRLDRFYRSGWAGHHEVVIPTVATINSMSIEDLNRLSNKAFGERLYDLTTFNHKEAKFSHSYMCYHPVKSLEGKLLIQAAADGITATE